MPSSAFLADALARNMLAQEVRDLRIVWHGSDLGNQPLDERLHRRRAEHQLAGQFGDRLVKSVGSDNLVNQADAQRRAGIERAAMHQELPRHARADSLDQHWNSDAGQQAIAHRGETEARCLRCDGEVAGQHQADAATDRGAVDPRDRRLGEVVDRLHRAHHGVRRDAARDGVEPGPGKHPVEVSSGGKAAAGPGHDHDADARVAGERLHRVDNGPRRVGVERVHVRRAIECQRRDTLCHSRQDG